MKPRAFRERLQRRLNNSGVALAPGAADPLERYFELLVKWNVRINLTALPLTPPSDEAIDRLFVEPLAAAQYFPDHWAHWFDLGSGNGSPAIPLRIVRDSGALTMVEAKTRKAAFLREVVRALELSQVIVENARFEDVARSRMGEGQLVTVRAVRLDREFAEAAAGLLGFEGRLFVFSASSVPTRLVQFDHLETVPLVSEGSSHLGIYRRVVPRGTSDRR